jgi:hypothetical protein
MYKSPPVYPQSDWFIQDENFRGYHTLEHLFADFSSFMNEINSINVESIKKF